MWEGCRQSPGGVGSWADSQPGNGTSVLQWRELDSASLNELGSRHPHLHLEPPDKNPTQLTP